MFMLLGGQERTLVLCLLERSLLRAVEGVGMPKTKQSRPISYSNTMFYFRLNKVKIFNNMELIGRSEVRLFSFITTDNQPLPALVDFLDTQNPEDRKAILKTAIKDSFKANVFPEVTKIRDNHTMFFGSVGLSLLTLETIPDNFNWQLLAVESDKRTRDNATLLAGILEDEGMTTLLDKATEIASKVSNPLFGIGLEVAKFATTTLLKVAQQDKDDQIGVLMMSLNRTEHYLHGKRDEQDVPDLTNNMKVDYTIFATE